MEMWKSGIKGSAPGGPPTAGSSPCPEAFNDGCLLEERSHRAGRRFSVGERFRMFRQIFQEISEIDGVQVERRSNSLELL
jgi:hypothetical protein